LPQICTAGIRHGSAIHTLVIGVVNCTLENLRDLIALQDAVSFGTRCRLLCLMLKDSIVKDPGLASFYFLKREFLRGT
jgi:hypothetical protein